MALKISAATTSAALMIMLLVPQVYAGGPRLDYDEDYEDLPGAPECWVNGYDAGFAGKYDRQRADECNQIEGDQYNTAWNYACKDGSFTPSECNGFKNKPVDIDHEALQQENAQNCWNGGYGDGKADNPFNKDRASGCSEYNPNYEGGYYSGCIIDSTESSCELLIEGEEHYCPWHPDITACVEFLYNATNKRPALSGTCAGMGDPCPSVICPQAIPKDTVSIIMIQSSAKQLETSVMQMACPLSPS